MLEHDAHRCHADDARRLHILLVALHERRTAHGACVLHPAGESDRDDQDAERERIVSVWKQGPADTGDQKRNQDRGKRKHHVAHPHDEGVDVPTRVARQQAQTDADQQRQHHRGKTDEQRNSRPVHQRRQHVAALFVGAQCVLGGSAFHPRRRQHRVCQVQRLQIERVVRSDQLRTGSAEDAHQRDQRGEHRDLR